MSANPRSKKPWSERLNADLAKAPPASPPPAFQGLSTEEQKKQLSAFFGMGDCNEQQPSAVSRLMREKQELRLELLQTRRELLQYKLREVDAELRHLTLNPPQETPK